MPNSRSHLTNGNLAVGGPFEFPGGSCLRFLSVGILD